MECWRRTARNAFGRTQVSCSDRPCGPCWTFCHTLVSGRSCARIGRANKTAPTKKAARAGGVNKFMSQLFNPSPVRVVSGPTSEQPALRGARQNPAERCCFSLPYIPLWQVPTTTGTTTDQALRESTEGLLGPPAVGTKTGRISEAGPPGGPEIQTRSSRLQPNSVSQ